MEAQISRKLQSNEPIDVEYWEQLLRSIAVYKAKAELNKVYKSIIDSRRLDLKREQAIEAGLAKEKLSMLLGGGPDNLIQNMNEDPGIHETSSSISTASIKYSQHLDPEPLLKLRPEDKAFDIIEEGAFLDKIVCDCISHWCFWTLLICSGRPQIENEFLSLATCPCGSYSLVSQSQHLL